MSERSQLHSAGRNNQAVKDFGALPATVCPHFAHLLARLLISILQIKH
jgi:hypothetical protein